MMQSGTGSGAAVLPVPPEAALAHSRLLTDAIRAEIEAADGHIPFTRFMELALYAPGLGYYSAGSEKIGAAGDFVTAPEISPLFSRCLARQCEQVIRRLGQGVILEPGAGTGTMAVDMLLELERRKALPEAYWILEPSAELRRRQEQTLNARIPRLMDRIEWLESLPARPFDGIILANEVLDAFPFDRICIEGGEVRELHVAWEDGRFAWRSLPAEQVLRDYVGAILDVGCLPDSYTTEVNRSVQPFIASLAEVLNRGLVLLVDYGYPRTEYYHPQRIDGTMLCHYRHRVHADPFVYVGLQDITASVDFTTVAEAAVTAGLEVCGFTTQAHFLLGCGLDDMQEGGGGDQKALLEYARQVKLLTLPAEMGERFKSMALGRGFDEPLAGFRLNDQRHRL
ncbi:MAG: SAM-dependent methyltransferase [Gammaproteobacteria bacterium]